MIKHGTSSGQDNVRVQPTTNVDGTRLDHLVDDLRQRGQEIGTVDFGIEEDFGSEETFVSYVEGVVLQIDVTVTTSQKELGQVGRGKYYSRDQ